MRTKLILYAVLGLAVATLLYWGLDYLAIGVNSFKNENPPSEPGNEEVDYEIEMFVSGLEVPWSIAWTSPERMLVAERPGRIREILNGQLKNEPLITFENISNESEEGLMGLALDPNYKTNRLLYACYAYPESNTLVGRVVQLKDNGKTIEIQKTILDRIPSNEVHAGCRVAFGPDGKLYVTTGDAASRDLAQNLKSLAGKILRLNSDGSIPADNPFPNSPVWSFGHRNPQGIAWHPATGELYETEHGPSVFDGPAGGDEVNQIVKGGNYGWPLVSHEETKKGTVSPLLIFTPAEAPASAAFYNSKIIPQFENNLFFGALRGEGLMRITFPKNSKGTPSYEKLSEVRFGRIRVVAVGPDGFLYFGTSNRDGRGNPTPEDDRLFRIRPES